MHFPPRVTCCGGRPPEIFLMDVTIAGVQRERGWSLLCRWGRLKGLVCRYDHEGACEQSAY